MCHNQFSFDLKDKTAFKSLKSLVNSEYGHPIFSQLLVKLCYAIQNILTTLVAVL